MFVDEIVVSYRCCCLYGFNIW